MKTSVVFVGVVVLAGAAFAQSSTNTPVRLPEITVVAEKEPAAAQAVAISVTPVTAESLHNADARSVKDAASVVPNAVMTDFGPPKLSNPYFRGVGASPKNPGVTTYLDGVPQLNGNSSSLQLIDVAQIEFVRGPQGALFGRNTVGGLINITSQRPTDEWQAEMEGSYGNYNAGAGQFRTAGPLVADRLGLSVAGGYSGRDGYTVNSVTGHRLDGRDDSFGKGQLLWKWSDRFEARLIVAGEHDEDGDYALGDLGQLRAHSHTVARDFEGYTHRDIVSPTLLLNYSGTEVEFSSISGGVWWKTLDVTDWDHSLAPFGYRQEEERAYQFTQEFRLASPRDNPVRLADPLALSWQAGVFAFLEDHTSTKRNNVMSFQDFDSQLQTHGVGAYGQIKLTAWERAELSVGLRNDYERAAGELFPAFAPAQTVGSSFDEVTPQFGLSYRLTPQWMAYGTVTRGYKAGGINEGTTPPGKATFGAEHCWNYEVGAKTEWFARRLQVNLAMFYIDWEQLQLPQFFGQDFYVDNAGAAVSRGLDLEVRGQPIKGWELFGSFGCANTAFLHDSSSMVGGATENVSGRRLPFAPDFTANAGTQFTWDVGKAGALYARAEVNVFGNYKYDAGSEAGQSAYTLAHFRLGWQAKRYFVEGWVKNALDTEYVPVALYWGTTPSGYVGESGAPLTFGIRAGFSL